jgi:hypothetical protein
MTDARLDFLLKRGVSTSTLAKESQEGYMIVVRAFARGAKVVSVREIDGRFSGVLKVE